MTSASFRVFAALLPCLGCFAQENAAPTETGAAVAPLIVSFEQGSLEERARAHDALLALGPAALAPLLAAMQRADADALPRISSLAERIVLRCAAPNRELDRRAAVNALRGALESRVTEQDTADAALHRQWTRWLGIAGGADDAEFLVALTRHQYLAETAVDALMRLNLGRGPASVATLFNPETPRLAEIAAVAAGEARDRGSIAYLGALAEKTDDPPAARAALAALAKMGEHLDAEREARAGAGLTPASALALDRTRAFAMRDRMASENGVEKQLLGLVERAEKRQQIGVALAGLQAIASRKAVPLAISYLNDGELYGLCRWLLSSAPAEAEKELRKAYEASSGTLRAALLEVLHARGAKDTAELLQEALIAPDPALRLVAARCAGRPADPGDALTLARGGPAWLRADALRMALDAGHAATISGDPAAGAAVFRTVLGENFPTAWNEALEALGASGQRGDEPLLRRFEDIGECREAAQVARARLVAREFAPEEARPLLDALALEAASDRAAATVSDALAQMGGGGPELAGLRGYILEWHQLGPFDPAEGGPPEEKVILKAAAGLASVDHAGERYAWAARRAEGLPALVIAHEQSDARRVYALARVPMPVWTPSTLEVVAPNEATLWINEKNVPLSGKRADILLQPGNNRILIRFDAACGGCGYGARLLTRRGAPLDLTRAAPPPDIAQEVGLDGATLGAITEKVP